MSATLDTLGALWNDLARVVEAELPACGCGLAHEVHSEVCTVPHMDAWEFLLAVTCIGCGMRHHGREVITGHMTCSKHMERFLEYASKSLSHGLKDAIVKHKKSGVVQPPFPLPRQQYANPNTPAARMPNQSLLSFLTNNDSFSPKPNTEAADIAEWLTHKLVDEKGKLHVTKLGGLTWKPQRIIDVADDMGFVQWPHLRLPKEHPLAA